MGRRALHLRANLYGVQRWPVRNFKINRSAQRAKMYVHIFSYRYTAGIRLKWTQFESLISNFLERLINCWQTLLQQMHNLPNVSYFLGYFLHVYIYQYLTCTHGCSEWLFETLWSSYSPGWPALQLQKSWRRAQSESSHRRRFHLQSLRQLLFSDCFSTDLTLVTYLWAKVWKGQGLDSWSPTDTESLLMKQKDQPLEQSILHGPFQSAYNRTEKAAATENGVCTIFDRAPVARRQKSNWISYLSQHMLT